MGSKIDAVIIDDEIDICILLSGMLKQYGITARYATSLREGLEKLSNSPNLILFLDNSLPDGYGLDSLIHIREKFPEVKVIMISAYDGDTERKIAAERGAIHFVGKPLTRALILPAIKSIFPDIIN